MINIEKARSFLLQSDSTVQKSAQKSKKMTELKECEEARESIEKIAGKVFSGTSVRIHLFGSRIIGLATDESDLDIFVEIGNGFSSSHDSFRIHDERFAKLATALECASDWTVKKTILRASVPIIICDFHRPLSNFPKLSCDINLKNGVSIRNSELFGHLFKLQSEAIKLFHFVKEWMNVQDFKIIKGYTLTLLVVFFLQSKNLMPTVKDLQLGASKETIDGCDVHFNRDSSLKSLGVTTMNSYKDYVGDFFSFYSSFDFSRVISTFDGKTYNDVYVYKNSFPKFYLKGIYVAGPIKRGNNCGVMDSYDKAKFISFCKASKVFFDENPL